MDTEDKKDETPTPEAIISLEMANSFDAVVATKEVIMSVIADLVLEQAREGIHVDAVIRIAPEATLKVATEVEKDHWRDSKDVGDDET